VCAFSRQRRWWPWRQVAAALRRRTFASTTFGRVNANYYRGAQPEGQDYNDLAALGVKTIIN
jgi:hypothetical protein